MNVFAVANGEIELLTNPHGQYELHFMPAADFFGDTALHYHVISADGEAQTVAVSLTVVNVNDAPGAQDDRLMVAEDTRVDLTQLLLNDGDVDGETVRIESIGSVRYGDIIETSPGQFVYEPPVDYVGTVEFAYVVVDDSGTRSIARAAITLTETHKRRSAGTGKTC